MLHLVEEEDIEKEKLEQIEKLEEDIQIISETMKLLNEIYIDNNISTGTTVENIKLTDEYISKANEENLNSTKEQKIYIKNTLVLTGLALVCINLPIGITYGINVFIASSTLTIAAGTSYLF